MKTAQPNQPDSTTGVSTHIPKRSVEQGYGSPERHLRQQPITTHRRWRHKRWLLYAALLTSGALAYQTYHHGVGSKVPSPASSPGSTEITRVIDGDTIVAKIAGKEEHVRLIGVDTPETVDPKRPVGCYGHEASEHTKALLPPHTAIRLELDAEPRDKYSRLLAYVYRASDNLFVNADLARNGFANVLTIPPNVTHATEMVQLVNQARTSSRGLWSACPTSH